MAATLCDLKNIFVRWEFVVDVYPSQARRAISVKLTDAAESYIRNIKTETGMTQVAFVERLLEWYMRLPRTVQREIWDKQGDPEGEILRLRAAEMAAAGQGPLGGSVPDTAEAMKVMLDQMVKNHQAVVEKLAETERARRKRKQM